MDGSREGALTLPMKRRYRVTHGSRADATSIHHLYRAVALQPGGIARMPPEITAAYVEDFVTRASASGVLQVAREPGSTKVIGEIHAIAHEVRAFAHVLGQLTLAVHPEHQGHGVGAALVGALLRQVRYCHPQIERVELVARESNTRAIRLYQRFGFRIEGSFERRIRAADGGYEADIPMAWLREPAPLLET